MFQMRLTDVRREVAEMLEGFEHQATFSLKKIDRRFESTGQSLDEEFRQYFLQVSIERLSTSYTKVQIATKRVQTETGGLINEPWAQAGYGLSDDDQLNSSHLGSSVKEEKTNSIDDDDDDDDNVNVKSKEDANELEYVEYVVEIVRSSDEEDIDESQNYHLETKIECEETDWMNDAIGNEMSQNNDEGNSDEVTIREEFYIEPKIEVIDVDPNDVSLNGDYRINDNVTHGYGAGTSLPLKARANDESDAQKPSCSKDSKRFNCELCKYGTNQKGSLNVHMRTHTKEKPFRCSRCPKRFTQSSALKTHMAAHKDEFPFHCSNCFRGFIQDNEKLAHEKSCRSRRYECYVCKYFTNRKTNLVIHMRTHTGSTPYRCSRCSKEFNQFQNLKYHMTTHKDKRLPFHCKGCFRRFSNESEKKAHEKDCRYRRYECEVCKKYVTANKTHIEAHMRIHTGEKPFRCEMCMKCFNQKSHLKYHLNNVHNRLMKSKMEAHVKGCWNRRYECDICKKFVTRYKTNMEIHMRVHTGEKPFRCEVCMKCFTQKGSLKIHLKNIHNRSNL